MWFLGFVFTLLGAGINQFFSLRYPSVHIVSLVAELIAYPCGVFLAKVLPVYTLNLGPLGRWCINPDHVSFCTPKQPIRNLELQL